MIVVSFSGNINAPTADKQGGDILLTITSDDKHTIHLWKWMNNEDKFCKVGAHTHTHTHTHTYTHVPVLRSVTP